MSKGICKELHDQIFQNMCAVHNVLTDEKEREELRNANEFLRALINKISTKKAPMIYEKIPLTTENVLKLWGGLLACLFTILRSLMNV